MIETPDETFRRREREGARDPSAFCPFVTTKATFQQADFMEVSEEVYRRLASPEEAPEEAGGILPSPIK